MTSGVSNRRKHIVATGTSVAEPFKPRLGRGNAKLPPIPDRATHGDALKKQLDRAWRDLAERDARHDAVAVDARRGIYLEFASAPRFDLALGSLEAKGAGIALAATRVKNGVQYATVYVPAGQLGYFEKKVAAYLTKTRDNGKPANKTLVESIAEIRLAALEGFWTDEPGLFPALGQTIWWEVWLRKDGDTTRRRFIDYATKADIKVGNKYLEFPDRLVVLAYGTREQMTDSVELVDVIAELRLAKEVPTRFLEMGTVEAAQWAKDLVTRIVPPPSTAPAVCILDTGLNAAHPLLAAAVPPNGVHTYHPTWGVIDKHGHGTEMAGIALFGDLTESLLVSSPAALNHWIESVKILHHAIPNPPELYGVITAESVARAEQAAPERNRAISLSIATKEFRDRGQPSSWSAEIDKLCAAGHGDPQRLLLVCAGNIEREGVGCNYPAENMTEGIHDPGQSWNAVTVGAFTNRTRIDDPAFDGWTPVARTGELSPTSSTSCIWDSQWPIKPDIVMEGGNMILSPSGQKADFADSLSLLTTYYKHDQKLFVPTGDTSAATAGAARIAAIIWAEYPAFWPETMRAILVHSAEWTRPMREQIEQSSGVREAESLLRCFGFGVPDLERALWSAGNALTLVVQDSLRPFERDTTNEMKLHALPWPVQELLQLGETMVELRVTLSYFVEPNPARRGWIRRHRYASHGLRFAMQAPTEALDEFRKRVNRAARAEDEKASSVDEGWTFGPNLRHKGSIHHDRWEGSAADLALRQHIAIYPATGWWSERHHLGRWKNDVRYALVVSIRTPETDVDIYQAVANKVKVGVTIAI